MEFIALFAALADSPCTFEAGQSPIVGNGPAQDVYFVDNHRADAVPEGCIELRGDPMAADHEDRN